MRTDESAGGSNSLTPAEWGLVLALAAVYFTHILDFVIVMPLGDQLRQQLGITPQQFGFVVSAYGFTATAAGVMAAAVVDRFDRKTVLLVTFAGFVVATVYCGLARDYAHLVAARCLAGLFGGLAASGVMAVIGDVIPDRKRGRAIGAVTSSFAVASTVGLPVGLTLATGFGHWWVPFLAIAGFGVAVWGLAAWRLPSLTGHRTGGRPNPFVQFAAVVRQPNHLASFAFMLAMVLGTFIVVPYIAPYMQANCGRRAEDLPWIYGIAGVCSLISMNVFGLLTDRVGPRPVFLLTAGGAIGMTLLITNLPPVPTLVAAATASGFMVLASGRIVPAQAMMLRSADPKLRGAFTNLNTAVSHLATGVGPLISGAVIGEAFAGGPLTGYWVAGLIAAGFGVTAIGLSFLVRPAAAPAAEVFEPVGIREPVVAQREAVAAG